MRKLKWFFEVAAKVGTWWVVLLFSSISFLAGDVLGLANVAWGILAIMFAFLFVYLAYDRAKQKVEEAYLQMHYTLKELKEDN